MLAKRAGLHYDPDLIETIAHGCIASDEFLLRILYYDCARYQGRARKPVSGDVHEFTGSDLCLRSLAQKDLFATRVGVLKFRGIKPKRIPIDGRPLTDDDFKPDFEQKGVDMRIGLDIANLTKERTVDRSILITADTDCAPAMKLARIGGLKTFLVAFPNSNLAPELLWHTDIKRHVGWPS